MNIFDLHPEKIIQILQEIYLLYSCKGINSEQTNITVKNLFRFFNDCELSKNLISTSCLDLIFISEKQKKSVFDFEAFLEIITRVSKAVYPEFIESSEAIYKFLENHVMTLYQKIHKTQNLLDQMDTQSLEILNLIVPMLKDMYKQEFP
jgi:hypothetical protein